MSGLDVSLVLGIHVGKNERGPRTSLAGQTLSMARGGVTGEDSLRQVLSRNPRPQLRELSQDGLRAHLHHHGQSARAWCLRGPGMGVGPYLGPAILASRYLLLSLVLPAVEFNESEKNYEVP